MKKIAGVVPAGILDQHVAVLGKTRSGKSSVMRQMVESLLDAGKPVCIVDPKGDWWGIKLAADGKGPGYPLVVFGGEHADVPINEHAGGHVAELFATGNRSCLIDLGGWTVGARTRFWIDFASTLFKLTKGQRWLAVDEFHNFAPKGRVMDADAGKMLHWSNRLASEGLGKGLNLLFASQRPQKVHNDSLTSAETLIAMRVLHPSDRGAVSDWIKGCGDGSGDAVLNSLGQMERGEGWVWSPEIGFGPTRVKFPLFSTYDSFRPQTVEDTKRLKGWAEVDLDEVRAKLGKVVEEAKANDPRELKKALADKDKRIKQLEAERAKPVSNIPESIPAAKATPALTDADRELLRKVETKLVSIDVKAGEIAGAAEQRASRLVEGVLAEYLDTTRSVGVEAARKVAELLESASVQKLIEKLNGLAVPAALEPFRNRPDLVRQFNGAPVARPAPQVHAKAAPICQAAAPRTGSVHLPPGEHAVLTAALTYPEGLERQRLTVLTGYKRSSRDAYIVRLAQKGLITVNGQNISATPEGVSALPDFEPLPTGQDLIDYWRARLPEGERRVLDVLLEQGGDVAREVIDHETNYKRSSRDAYLVRMRARGVVVDAGRGMVRASAELLEGR